MLPVTENPPNSQSLECLPHSVCTFRFSRIGLSLLLLLRCTAITFSSRVDKVGDGDFDDRFDLGGDLPLIDEEEGINWLAVSRKERLLLRSCGGDLNRDEVPRWSRVDRDVVSSFVDKELIVEVQVDAVGERENIDSSDSSSLLVLREYVEAAIVEEEEGILRSGIGMLSVCFPSLILGNCRI